ncbi:MAG: SusC/RagA family TonB-linked outer membrane protein [Flavobacteriaceae bacterium]|nr:SusC/RagA family TonB-linked outer membrane protein [Flavobacteriaceae bacterium]
MKTKFSGILTLLLAFVVQFTFAQEKTISGTVTDESGPLPGVSVVIKGTGTGAETDFDGKYTIKVNTGDVLRFSFVGMTTKEVTVGESNTIDVVMQADNVLEEVIVTAYGIKKETRSLGYAAQEVKAEAITNSGASNVLDALSGKSSGVQITRSSGSAGGGSRIVIRGATSMVGNNQALIIIDGVRSNNETLNAQAPTAGTASSNRLMDLNSDDIESISVLKGAAATAVYGTAGSGGVILITTKKGTKGQRLQVSVSSQVAFDQVSQLTQLQDTYAQGRLIGGVTTYRGSETGESGSWGPRLSDLEYSTDSNIYNATNTAGNFGNAFDADGNYRWDNNGFLVPRGQGNGTPANNYNKLNSDDFFRTGVSLTNNISISGSNEAVTYRFSASDLKQEGIVPNEEYKRRTFNLGATLKANDKLSFETAINYARSDYNRIQQGSNTSGLLLGLYRTPASFDNSNGLGTGARDNALAYEFPEDRSQRNYRGGGGYDNPYWTINNAPATEEVHRLFGNFKTNYVVNNWINLGLNVGVDITTDKRKQAFEVGSRTNPTGRIILDDYLTRQSDVNLFVTGDGDITDDFSFNYLVGANYFSFVRDQQNEVGIGLLFPGFMDISNTATISSLEDKTRFRSMGIFANAQVGWKDMLYLNFSARQDYDSRLRDPSKEFKASDIGFFYPSVSGSFVFTEVLPKNKILSFGKIRASWAQVGAPPPVAYSTSTSYEVNDIDGTGIAGGWGNGITFPISTPNGQVTTFELDNILGNSDLKPEITTTTEYGIDLRFFGNRLTLDVAYFKSDIDDAILNQSLSASSGFTSKWVNAGIMTSDGWEITVGAKPIVSENFNWNTTINWSKSETIVKRLAPGIERLFLAGFATAGTYLVEGLPYGAIVGGAYLREEAGTASDTSLSIPGGAIVIDPATGYQAVDNTQRVIGDPNPDFILGWNNSFTYKNLTLNFLLDWKKGGDIWNGTAWALSFFGRSQLTADTREETPIILDGVFPDGSPNNIPIVRDRSYWTSAVGGFGSVGEQFVEDGGWIRLRELSLSYNFSKDLFKNILIESAYITFTGRNLWIDTDFDGVDPETSLTGNGNGQGFDYFNMPGTKSYMFKVGFNF